MENDEIKIAKIPKEKMEKIVLTLFRLYNDEYMKEATLTFGICQTLN